MIPEPRWGTYPTRAPLLREFGDWLHCFRNALREGERLRDTRHPAGEVRWPQWVLSAGHWRAEVVCDDYVALRLELCPTGQTRLLAFRDGEEVGTWEPHCLGVADDTLTGMRSAIAHAYALIPHAVDHLLG